MSHGTATLVRDMGGVVGPEDGAVDIESMWASRRESIVSIEGKLIRGTVPEHANTPAGNTQDRNAAHLNRPARTPCLRRSVPRRLRCT